MSGIAAKPPNLDEAIREANNILSKQGYTVAVQNKEIKAKEPVFLQLRYANGKTRNIGIIHLVHLIGSNDEPFEKIARTTSQVVTAILKRVALFFDAEKHSLHIDENGTIFDFNQSPVKIDKDNKLSINGKAVTLQGEPLLCTQVKSEGIIVFKPLNNGHIQLFDEVDKREKKGIFIDPKGAVYRA